MDMGTNEIVIVTNLNNVISFFEKEFKYFNYIETKKLNELKDDVDIAIVDLEGYKNLMNFDGFIFLENTGKVPKVLRKNVVCISNEKFYENLKVFIRIIRSNKKKDTEKKKLFKFLDDTLESYKREYERSESLEEEERVMLSIFSHETRTPINIILGNAELIEREGLNAKQLDYLSKIYKSGKYLKDRVNELNWFKELMMNKVESNLEVFCFEEMIESIMSYYVLLAEEKGLKINIGIDEKLGKYYNGEKRKIEVILRQFISNAIKFTNKGEVNIKINSIEINGEEENVGIMVTDTGIGIESTKIEELVLPFRQDEHYLKRKKNGLGLGLTIVHFLSEWMQTKIEIISELNKGSSFFIKLKLKRVESVDDVGFENVELLLVEDSELNRYFIREELMPIGVTITEAVDGIEALALLKIKKFDMIFMDNIMPKMDGVTASKEIRKNGIETPIIMFTASVGKIDKSQIISLGINDLIEKNMPLNYYKKILIKYLSENKIIKLEDIKHNEVMDFGSYKYFDVNIVLNRLNYKFNLIVKLIEAYLTQSELFDMNINNLEKNIEKEKTKIYFHTYNGIIKGLECQELSYILDKIEKNLYDKNIEHKLIEDYKTLNEYLKIDIQDFLEKLKNEIEIIEKDKISINTSKINLNTLKTMILNFEIAIKKHDIRQIRNISLEIKNIELPVFLEKDFEELFRNISNYQYKLAAKCIVKILNKEDFKNV